jgi:hypothetical protein
MTKKRVPPGPACVFLSHSSKDTAALKKLVAVLRDHGIKVW